MARIVHELEHRYGPRVHLLSDPFLLALAARIGSPETTAPALMGLLRGFYSNLLARAAAAEFPVKARRVDSRMKSVGPNGCWEGEALDPDVAVVIANVMRAGNVPALACFEQLATLLDPARVRIDHLYFARRAGADGHVAGIDCAGSKIGGSIEGAMLLVPDPMGATGSTTLRTLDAYRQLDAGRPAKVLALHLIVTPEYLRNVLAHDESVTVWAARVDRGASPADVAATVPGTQIERESGLDAHDYIVPGAGGLGEVINNSWC